MKGSHTDPKRVGYLEKYDSVQIFVELVDKDAEGQTDTAECRVLQDGEPDKYQWSPPFEIPYSGLKTL